MKTLLFTLFGSMFFLLNSPNIDNFSIKNGVLIWQKIYDTELSKEQLIHAIRSSGDFSNISVYKDNLIAEISELSLSHKEYNAIAGVKAPHYAIHKYLKSYVVIDFKENRYRVTIKSIKFTPKDFSLEFGSRIFEAEEIFLDSTTGNFNNRFLKKGSKIMDFTFQKITDFTKQPTLSEW